jgi:hypothetical protein
MMRKSYARFVCPSVALAALALACCARQSHPAIQNFKKIEIDPTTLKVTLEEPLPLNSPVGYDYYALFRGATTVTVDHGGPSGSKIAYNALDLDDDGNLLMRIKSQVLAQGPYGTIYAKSTYYYGGQYAHQPPQFDVESWSNMGSYEPAQEGFVDTLGELTAISIVRIFTSAPGYLVACATYDPSGKLVFITVNGAKNGDWVHSNEVQTIYPDLDVATQFGDRPRTRKFFGLPENFPISEYSKTPRDMGEHAALTSFSDIINLHYQRNRHVRQDVFSPDGSHVTHLLVYKTTPEDQQLAAVDAAMYPRH